MGFDIEKSAGFLLAKAHQRIFAAFRNELEPYGLTPQQFALLAFLWREDGLSQVELSDRTEIDRSTIGGLVDRLSRAGHVERRRSSSDRRICMVFLTESGRGLREDLSKMALRVRQYFTRDISEEEYETLSRLLAKIRRGGDPG